MKIAHRLIAALMGLGIVTSGAQAQGIDRRHYNQDRRIEQGVRSGRLTPHEARRIEHQQRSIRHQENRMRYRNGGHLSRHDRAVLQHREDRASRHIYRAKHNGRHW